MVVSTSQLLLSFLGEALRFPLFTRQDSVVGAACMGHCGRAAGDVLSILTYGGDLEVVLEMKMLFSSWP